MSKEDIKELKLRLDIIEDKLSRCFVTNLNENIVKRIVETKEKNRARNIMLK